MTVMDDDTQTVEDLKILLAEQELEILALKRQKAMMLKELFAAIYPTVDARMPWDAMVSQVKWMRREITELNAALSTEKAMHRSVS